MNSDTTLHSSTRWSALDSFGYGIGCVAGGVALLLLWAYSLVSGVRRR